MARKIRHVEGEPQGPVDKLADAGLKAIDAAMDEAGLTAMVAVVVARVRPAPDSDEGRDSTVALGWPDKRDDLDATAGLEALLEAARVEGSRLGLRIDLMTLQGGQR